MTIEQLQAELTSVKAGYEQLDRNWHAVHEAAMSTIERVVGLPAEYEGGRLNAIADVFDKLQVEREAVLKFGRENCHSGVNAERHRMALELLVLMGDRPEAREAK